MVPDRYSQFLKAFFYATKNSKNYINPPPLMDSQSLVSDWSMIGLENIGM